MADNVPITAGTGTNIAADEVTDGTLGTVKVQFVKVMSGALDSTNKLIVDSHGSEQVTVADATGTAVDYTVTVPTGQIGVGPATNVAGVVTANTPLSASSGNVANATAACTLTAAANKTTYISGFSMTAGGSTAGSDQSLTITGPIGGTMTFTFNFPTGALVGSQLNITFNPPIPASTTNTAIVVSCPAGGTGNTNAAVNAWGFQL